jgi:hypothetical protein
MLTLPPGPRGGRPLRGPPLRGMRIRITECDSHNPSGMRIAFCNTPSGGQRPLRGHLLPPPGPEAVARGPGGARRTVPVLLLLSTVLLLRLL